MRIINDFTALVDLIDFLATGAKTLTELKDKMQLCERTVFRRIDKIQDCGILIEKVGFKPTKYRVAYVNKEFKSHFNTLQNALHRLNA